MTLPTTWGLAQGLAGSMAEIENHYGHAAYCTIICNFTLAQRQALGVGCNYIEHPKI